MRSIISESPNGKQRIVIDPSSETVTFHGCHISPAKSFFSIARPQAEFVCRFEDILNLPDDWEREGGRMCVRQIVTAYGHAFFRADWTNFDETRNILREITKSTPDAPMQANFNVAGRLLMLVSATIALILIFVFFWLTGN